MIESVFSKYREGKEGALNSAIMHAISQIMFNPFEDFVFNFEKNKRHGVNALNVLKHS